MKFDNSKRFIIEYDGRKHFFYTYKDPTDFYKIRDEIHLGRRINAIKLHREFTGNGLVESRDYVEYVTQNLTDLEIKISLVKLDHPEYFL